jgi:dynein heavy chain, axonemal
LAHVHTSVNSAANSYLAATRRHNYTTPKSYLEQISLYSKLLREKDAELNARIERLQNGLEKLRSTAAQVDGLKETLAQQEVEVQKKNEAADKLIQIVGIETEKVSKEKVLGTTFILLKNLNSNKINYSQQGGSKGSNNCQRSGEKAARL